MLNYDEKLKVTPKMLPLKILIAKINTVNTKI